MTSPPVHDLDRLADLLARSAHAVDVRPDVAAVLAGDRTPSPLVDLGRRPRDTRRILALAAGLVVVLGLVGAALVAIRPGDRPVDTAQSPPDPYLDASDRFPVLGHVPAELAGEPVVASEGEPTEGARTTYGSVDDIFVGEAGEVRSALGRVAADGSISDVVQLAGAQTDGPSADPVEGAPYEDLGGGVRILVAEQEVRIEAPGVALFGVGGVGRAEAVLRSLVDELTAGTTDAAALLAAVDVPDGSEVVVPPTEPSAERAEVAVSQGESSVAVATGVGPPALAVMAPGQRAVPVDVDGIRGLAWGDGTFSRIAWTAPNGVDVAVQATGVDDVLAIAEGVELVDEDTWRTTYPERVDDVTDETVPGDGAAAVDPLPGAETPREVVDHPLVGQPLPDSTASEHRSEGDAVIVGFSPTEEAGVVRVDGTLVAPSPEPWVPEGFLRTGSGGIVTANGPGDRIVAEEQDLADLADWSLAELPTTVVAGPAGIVRAVFVGGTTVEALQAALAE